MFLTEEQIKNLKFKSVGKNVLISDKASIYNAENMSIGNNVRIDDFCILSGNIEIGDNVHISAYSALYGGNDLSSRIVFKNNTGCSARTTIYAITDDFKTAQHIGVMQSLDKRILIKGEVIIEENVQIGAGCIIFPNVHIKEGSRVYAMSLIKEDIPQGAICAGIPARVIKYRNAEHFEKLKAEHYKHLP